MKICIFGHASAVHIQRIVRGLAARGQTIHIVTGKPCAVPGATVETFRVPHAGLTNPRRWQGRWERYLEGFLRRFDVVHVHFLHDWGFTPELMERGCFMVSPWGSDIVEPPDEQEPSVELRESRIAMLRHAAGVTTWGPTFAAEVARYADIDVDRIHLLPLGVDLDLFRPADRKTARAGEEYHVGCFKGFRAVYGPTYLMHAIPRVLERLPPTRFHLIGDGPQLDQCRQLAQQNGTEASVEWIPRQPHDDIPRHVADWDLTLIPSVCESFGAAALESSAMCVPVVASDVGGIRDTVRHGETGLLVPAEEPEALSDAISTLLNAPRIRRRMGEAGRALVERDYDWQVILDKWVCTYEAVRERLAVMV
ncbi:MAG: glycosyltransferase family 4 protein [Planctomycetota bacterium]